MKTYMPLNGLRWSRNSGSANCDMPQSAVFGRPGGYYCFVNVTRPPSSSLSSLEQLTTVNPIKRITYKDKSFVFIIWCT